METYEVGSLIICNKWGLVIAVIEYHKPKQEYKGLVINAGTNTLLKKGMIESFDKNLPWHEIITF